MQTTNFTSAQRESIVAHLIPLLIIVMALVGGVLTFTVIALVISEFKLSFKPDPLVMVAAVMSFPCILASFLIPKIMAGRQARLAIDHYPDALKSKNGEVPNGVIEELLTVYKTGLIVRCALIEGPAFLWAVTILIGEGSGFAIIAIPVLLALMLMNLPTANRMIDWIDHQLSEARRG